MVSSEGREREALREGRGSEGETVREGEGEKIYKQYFVVLIEILACYDHTLVH